MAVAVVLVGLAIGGGAAWALPLDAVGRFAVPSLVRRAAGSPCRPGRPVRERPITRPRWLHHVAVTEYYSVPERWFRGRAVAAPGLAGRHRVDWLYSARGVAMEGDGIARDGSHVHIDALGGGDPA